MSRPLIGLIGSAGSGKSLVGRRLAEKHGYSVLRIAEPIKRMLTVGLGLTAEQLDGRFKQDPLADFGGLTPRQIMQTLGYEWGRRSVHPDIWITIWRRAYEASTGPVVVDDMRFAEEAEVVRQLGGAIWHVYRPSLVVGEHPTERFARDARADVTITNTSTVPELLLAVDEALAA